MHHFNVKLRIFYCARIVRLAKEIQNFNMWESNLKCGSRPNSFLPLQPRLACASHILIVGREKVSFAMHATCRKVKTIKLRGMSITIHSNEQRRKVTGRHICKREKDSRLINSLPFIYGKIRGMA